MDTPSSAMTAAGACLPSNGTALEWSIPAGYSSWYNHYQNINQADICADQAGAAPCFLPATCFRLMTVWEPYAGDWLEPNGIKFPGGMKAVADEIHGAGFLAGLWLAPFVCEADSDLYQEHPVWLLKVDGNPWKCGSNWSGFYALDTDVPAVQNYLRLIFDRVLNQWGFDPVKLDFKRELEKTHHAGA